MSSIATISTVIRILFKYGKRYCPSHYIKMKDMERIVLEDIRSLAEDEEKAKAKFLVHKAKQHEEQYSVDTKNSQMADTVCRSLIH